MCLSERIPNKLASPQTRRDVRTIHRRHGRTKQILGLDRLILIELLARKHGDRLDDFWARINWLHLRLLFVQTT